MIFVAVPIQPVARKVQTPSARVKLDSCIERIGVLLCRVVMPGVDLQWAKSRIAEQRLEAVIHVLLDVAVEERQAGVVGD